ncbi:armadillo repeat-containing protein 1 [Astyanax mexicanus]|uniref:Armadillo repeat-containing protein 1 n=2 Tax=Astyanax mexicanus TaxID=7994 RepID=A0A8B9JD71_ASTMX|nr:armadillo repeat-containing protein 1 [Astyanax mexicanus]KAG9278244.1 armadillo repeat-containing protein 1-like [Astyanax mexicanus]
MAAEPDALAVVNQLRELTADPLNRRAIAEDQGCIPGLILFLDHSNPEVVYSALQALRYLSECRANREKMSGEFGMLLSLQNIVEKTTTPGETRLLASEVYELLRNAGADGGGEDERGEETASCRRKAQFFLGSSNKRAKTVTLHIDGLDDSERRTLCEEVLLRIRGVISFTFQMAVKRCIVRIRSDLTAETLGSAIASTKVLKAQHVVKTENGEEVLIPFHEEGEEEDNAPVSINLPEYLSEDDSPSVEKEKVLSRVGSASEGSGWLASATNFLSRSFYW